MFCCCLINVRVRVESRKWFPLGPRVSQEQAWAGVGRVRRDTMWPRPGFSDFRPRPGLSDFHQIHLFLYCPATKQKPSTNVAPSLTGKILLSLRPPALRKSHLSLQKGTSPTWSGVEWVLLSALPEVPHPHFPLASLALHCSSLLPQMIT